MKLIVMLFIIFLSLEADDIERIDAIVSDIQNLKESAKKSKNLNNDRVLEKKIAVLEAKIKKQARELKKKPKVIVKTIIKEIGDNSFPKLKMKPEYFVSGTFRVNKDANIYDGINGNVIAVWEKRTSFTSSERTDTMIKITGYFVEKVWRKAEKPMWVKSEDAFER